MNADELAKSLMNIGPKTSKQLVKAGIDTPEKLRKLGAKKAFLKIYESGGFCDVYHAAYLYALWGAIYDCPWQHVPEEKKKEFKKFTEELRKNVA